jgi:type I restriction enzyme S subunit
MAAGLALAEQANDVGELDGQWSLPEGWCWVPLGEIVDIHDHRRRPIKSEDRQTRIVGKPSSELFPYYGATGQVGLIDGFLFDFPAILLGEDGAPFLDRQRAKAYTVGGRYWVNNHAHILTPRTSTIGPWLLHALNFIDYEPHVGGTTRLKLTKADLERIPIPLAPLAEQRRIVARVDALFAEIAEGEAALAAARKGLDIFRRALLKAAVSGEFTRDWRAANPVTESGHDLLARIARERAARGLAKGRVSRNADAPSLDTSTLPTLPESWAWTTLGELFDVSTGSTPSRSDPKLWNGGIPWVSSGEVAFCRIRSTHETISMSGLGNPATRLNPAGTVLLAMIGEGKTRGQCAILDVPAANNQNAAAIRVSATPIPPEFVYHLLEERYFRSRRESQGGNQPALNGGKVAGMAIPLPPLNEIVEILRRVSDALAAADDTLAMLDAEAADAARLKQSILKAAFESRLVVQNIADEPAAALLSRIKATDSTATPARRGRRSKS